MRIAHLGVGNFSRAHQAWYTMAADGDREWGIAAFTGRRPDVADLLAPQEGLYTLLQRGPDHDRLDVIDVLQEVHAGTDLDALVARVAAPQTALVTLTLTEGAYREIDAEPHASALGRLTLALAERSRGGDQPLALVSCDNLHRNGSVLRARVLELADQLDIGLADWIDRTVAFVSTSVDRITPRTVDEDLELVRREIGFSDEAVVVCEPFSDWVLCGEFPAGRPRWEAAGARFVNDIEPWELRKLWLLNGGHSLLAYMGLLRGHQTVADAIADPELGLALDRFWDLAERHLPSGDLDIPAYRRQLRERFENARIGYPLTQIAADGLDKLRNRIVPVIEAARAAGDSAEPAAQVMTAWAHWLISDPDQAKTDQNSERLLHVLQSHGGRDSVQALIETLAPGLISTTTNSEESE